MPLLCTEGMLVPMAGCHPVYAPMADQSESGSVVVVEGGGLIHEQFRGGLG